MVQPPQQRALAMTRISICIPAYNNASSLKRCLDSVFEQTFRDFEVIVSDDSTHSEVQQLVERYQHDPRLHYHRNPQPLGSPANWNHAMQLAAGNYIKILHHDDCFTSSDSLQQFAGVLEAHPEVSFFFCQSQIHFKASGDFFLHRPTRRQLKRLQADPAFLFFRNVIGAPSATCFKNDRVTYFDESFKWLVDVEFYLRYLALHPGCVYIAKHLVTVTDGEAGQITRQVADNPGVVIPEHLRLFAQRYNALRNTPKSRLFFGELFERFGFASEQQLRSSHAIPSQLDTFVANTFHDLPQKRWLKKIKKRWLTSRYNKRIFKRERF